MLNSRQAPLRVAVLSVALLVGGLAAGVALADDSPGTLTAAGPAPGSGAGTPTGAAALKAPDSCQDLLDHLIAESIESVGPWGWDFYNTYWARDSVVMRLSSAPPTLQNLSAATSPVDAQSSSATGTNVQEAGIDEPDIAKTDGAVLVRINGRTLTTYDVTGDEVSPLGTLTLPGRRSSSELLLSGDRVLVLSRTWHRNSSGTRVTSVDISTPRSPQVVDARTYDGELLSARLTGTDVRLVTSTALPSFDFVQPGKNRTRKQAKQENTQIVSESGIDDWLPAVHRGSEAEQYLDCADVRLPAETEQVGVMSVVGFPITQPEDVDSTAVVTNSQIVYTSADRLYLATGFGWFGPCCMMGDLVVNSRTTGFDGSTDLHSFALSGTAATYVASGRVDGRVADRWSMDSVDGVLRVAVATSEKKGKRKWESANAVVTLGEEAAELVELDRVDGLGIDEQIQSVRWFDDLAIVVTFRQVDPLYAIDVSDPSDLELRGELKIPGFSAYLHPIGDDRLIGLGEDATLKGRSLGAQASTFDISDPTAPSQLDKVTYGRSTELLAAWEPRQFTWLDDSSTALTVLTRYGRSLKVAVSALTVAPDGSLTETSVPQPGNWGTASSMRTLPLPDGRVVVTSNKETAFLSW